ncbi:unnamed protein product [Mytilus coruscus]|uniref:Uncharacterized protein n=1 Tax=Mytilus coruscus TaxID=42192 RepID=A0A6J8BXN0_MYTCO|nr:unnamed protein product [Mytilus coruscus]
MPTLRSKGVQRNAQLWMPPKCVVQTLAKNVDCLIQYYLSAGLHFAPMPEFLVEGCLLKLQSGEIEYNFGPESLAKDIKGERLFPEKKKLPKRKIPRTPQKSKKWKLKPQASTLKNKHSMGKISDAYSHTTKAYPPPPPMPPQKEVIPPPPLIKI